VHQVSHIDDSLILLNKKRKNLTSKIRKIENGMNEWRSQTDTLTSEVEAIVSSDQAQAVSFKLSYLTYDAGWNTLLTRYPFNIVKKCGNGNLIWKT
jgi:hypothetical protein